VECIIVHIVCMACIVGGRAASDKPMDGARRDMSMQSKKKRKTRRSKHGSDQEGDGDLSDETGAGVCEFWIMLPLRGLPMVGEWWVNGG